MLVKDFANETLKVLNSLPSEDKQLNFLLCLESNLAFFELRDFLDTLSSCAENMNIKWFNRILDFLSVRWFMIKETDASYFHNQVSRANKGFCILAQRLFQNVRPLELKFDHYYELLMPSLAASIFCLSKKKLGNYKLNELILSDEGIPIEIQVCLDDAANCKILDLYQTNDITKKLSPAEAQRVIHHSTETECYYESIQYCYQTDIDNDMIVARENLARALVDDAYKVQASYGQKGEELLQKNILNKIKTKSNLIMMLKSLPKEYWQDFLNLIPKDLLKQYYLPETSLLQIVRSPNFCTGNEELDRINFYIITELYKKLRSQEKNYTSGLGYLTAASRNYFGYFTHYVCSFKRIEKLNAAQALQEFLRSSLPLSEMTHYFANNQSIEGPLFEYELISELGAFTHMIKKYYPPQARLAHR